MKRKISGSVTASGLLFIASGMLASVLGLRQYDRVTTETTWVASSTMEAGQVMTAADLKQGRVKSDVIVINDPRKLLGRTLKVSKRAEDGFSAEDFEQERVIKRKSLAQQVPAGRVLYTLQLPGKAGIPYSQLRGGDRLDILVRGRSGVRTAAVDVRLLGIIKPRGPGTRAAEDGSVLGLLPQKKSKAQSLSGATSLVLAVHPGHVYPLANISGKESVSLVLHSALDAAVGKTLEVTPVSTRREVEVMTGLKRSSVFVSL